ncbi:MAG: hypothetical protein ACK5QK_13975 [Chryseotalea sp.]
MKKWLGLAVLAISVTNVWAQHEDDDLYFNKKDRAKIQKTEAAYEPDDSFLRGDRRTRFDYPIDGPTAEEATSRQVNPEFVSRSVSTMNSHEDADYFVENYQYNTNQNLTSFPTRWDRWNNAPLYSNSFFAPGINRWNSPFYSPINDPFFNNGFNNPWCNPMFGNGLSIGFNTMWGNGWNNGWMNPGFSWGFGFNNWGFYDPWGWNNWNNPWAWNNWNNVIFVDNNYRAPVYGKRGTRSQNSSYTRSTTTRNRNVNTTSPNYRTTAGNRSSRSGQTEYYTPQWRRTGANQMAPAQRTRTENNWFNNSNNNSRSFGSPDRSFSAPTRNSGGGGNSGGGARTRGRGN